MTSDPWRGESVAIKDVLELSGFSPNACSSVHRGGPGDPTPGISLTLGRREKEGGVVSGVDGGTLGPAPRWALLRTQYLRNQEIRAQEKALFPIHTPFRLFY